MILKNQGRLEEAIEAYRRALQAAPDFQIVQNNLAIALTEKATAIKNEGKLEEGLPSLPSIVKSNLGISFVPLKLNGGVEGGGQN